jgi:uncharacterized protein
MQRIKPTTLFLGLLGFFLFSSCGSETAEITKEDVINHFETSDYEKQEINIEMRDGALLHTSIYSPSDKTQEYPVIIRRSPYSCSPYGPDTIPASLSHNPKFVESGYIFVFQDVRGRWNSEGHFENTKPPYSLWDSTATDEITDSYDTFEWLKNNLENFNGNIGQFGNSYPGMQTLIGARANHPNLKAVMAMAPVTSFYFEDFSRYGIFAANYIPVLNAFGTNKTEPTTESWYDMKDSIFYTDIENKVGHPYYEFFQERLALTEFEDILGDNYFWKNIKAHPNYDEYHEKRNWVNHMDAEMTAQVMVVGGWNDEQNLYGILNSYKSISKKNPNAQLVVGPWSHGHNKKRDSLYYLGDIYYGEDLSKIFQETIEYEYFEYHLKNRGEAPDFKIRMFDMGLKTWNELEEFPATSETTKTMYLQVDGSLTESQEHQEGWREYVSDPFNPVPYLESNEFARMAPKSYMTADQRFLSEREDVLTYTSEALTEDLRMSGNIEAIINFSTELEDADLYVKLMDVYPEDRTPEENDAEGINFQGYQQMVRQGYIRGRFRGSFSHPKPFNPGEKTEVRVPLLEVYYTFKKDHKIMVQIQSSMFPLFGVNPQNYVDNVYEATKSDFKASKHKVFNDSKLIFPIK